MASTRISRTGGYFTGKPAGEPIAARPDAPQLGRRLYIKPADIEAFGWTRDCPRCDHVRTYGAGRTPKPHPKLCRRRTMSELIKTPEGTLRVDSAYDIVDRSVAEQTERQDHREGTSQGDNHNDDHVVPRDPPTPARFEPLFCRCLLALLSPLNLCLLCVLSRQLRVVPRLHGPTSSTSTVMSMSR